jgi:outer membrane protein, multidrug efflux system
MNITKNKPIKILLALACLQVLPSCAPLLQGKTVDIEVPNQFRNQNKEPGNTAEMEWQVFFDDPHLEGLIDTALAHNQEIKIAMQDINMANNEVYSRTGEYAPFLSFKSTVDLEKVGRYTRNGAVEANTEIRKGQEFPEPLPNFMVGVFASWELDVWKRLRNAKDVAVFEYMASIEGRKFLITQLVAEIANSYYELLALDNKLKNLEESIAIQTNMLRIIRLLKQAARTNELAVKRFEAEVQKNQSKIYGLRQDIAETENKINYLVGRRPQPIVRDPSRFAAFKPQTMGSGLPSQLLNNRPDIKQAENELAATDLNVQVAKAKFYPSFGMNAGVGYQAFNPLYLVSTPQSLTYSLSVDMAMPLINKNAITADYQNANARQIKAAYEYERTILNAYREVANQLAKIENLDQNYALKNQQVETLNLSIDISGQLFKAARADYMEVLLTQREAIEARMELIETRQSQLSARVNLYQALGGGWKEMPTPQMADPKAPDEIKANIEKK